MTQEGLLASEPNCGVRVSQSTSPWIQPLIVRQRIEIEIFALRKSMPNIDASNIVRLEEKADKLGDACRKQDLGAVVKYDIDFHRSLLDCAGEDDLTAIWLPLVTRMVMNYSRHIDMSQSHEEHLEILNAIREKDLRRSIKALKVNIQ